MSGGLRVGLLQCDSLRGNVENQRWILKKGKSKATRRAFRAGKARRERKDLCDDITEAQAASSAYKACSKSFDSCTSLSFNSLD